MATIGPPTVTNSSQGERPMRQISDGRGGFVLTPLSEQEMAERDARERQRIDNGAERLKEMYRERLYGPAEDAAQRGGPDPVIRLGKARTTLIEVQAKVAEQREARDRAQRHLQGAERALAALIEHHRRLDGNRVTAAARAITEGRDPEEAELPSNAGVERAADRVAVARRALDAINGEFAKAEAAVTLAQQEVFNAAEAVLTDQAERLVDQLIEIEAHAAVIRSDLWALGTLTVPTPGEKGHQFQVSGRVQRAVNGAGAGRMGSPSIDWASRLRALIAGEE